MNILEQAAEIIYGDREKTYGTPESNLGRIAKYWTDFLNNKGIQGTIVHTDVALMMVLLKIARLQNDINHEDSIIDGVGYLALIDRIKNGI